jgi:cytosine/adenosine deaminase-related metal-dependent hydrolase
MSTKSILLHGGTVLTHSANDQVLPIKADLLIEENIITKIEDGIKPPLGTEVIDCTDKILSPGFVDTHHHVWQTLLKGRHANELLLDYLPSGMPQTDFGWMKAYTAR